MMQPDGQTECPAASGAASALETPESKSCEAPPSPPTWRLIVQFVGGLAWMGMLISLFWSPELLGNWIVFAGMTFNAVLAPALALPRFMAWLRRVSERPRRFGLATLLLVMMFIAGYCAFLGWLTRSVLARPGGPAPLWFQIFFLCLAAIVPWLTTCFLLVLMGESLRHFGAWVRCRPRRRRASWRRRRR